MFFDVIRVQKGAGPPISSLTVALRPPPQIANVPALSAKSSVRCKRVRHRRNWTLPRRKYDPTAPHHCQVEQTHRGACRQTTSHRRHGSPASSARPSPATAAATTSSKSPCSATPGRWCWLTWSVPRSVINVRLAADFLGKATGKPANRQLDSGLLSPAAHDRPHGRKSLPTR